MLTRILLIAISAMVVVACSKDDSTTTPDPVVEVEFDNIETLKATIGGTAFSGVPVVSSVAAAGPGKTSFTIGASNAGMLLTLSAVVNDTGKGDYTLGTGGNNSIGVVIPPRSYTTQAGATGTLTVEKIDLALKRMKGKFNGTIKHTDGEEKTVAGGTFEFKW